MHLCRFYKCCVGSLHLAFKLYTYLYICIRSCIESRHIVDYRPTDFNVTRTEFAGVIIGDDSSISVTFAAKRVFNLWTSPSSMKKIEEPKFEHFNAFETEHAYGYNDTNSCAMTKACTCFTQQLRFDVVIVWTEM